MEKTNTEQKCKVCAWAFAVCLAVSIGLIVGGFFVPPKGVIDGSVLKGVGELFAFAALAVGGHAITLGYDLKISKGETSVDLSNNKPNEQ
jgi:hypothetical protein